LCQKQKFLLPQKAQGKIGYVNSTFTDEAFASVAVSVLKKLLLFYLK
jgi:hypothetical protein